ncbi:MAG: lasso peptide biosynthesis B2 protein [Thermomicrobiales bacterium]
MGRLRKLLALSGAERRLLIRALPLVVLVRVALWVLPFRRLRRWQGRWATPAASVRGDEAMIPPVVRAVTLASRAVPGASCLTQALAAQVLLARRGCPSELRLGVGRGADRRFAAHAWLEYDGRPIIGEFEAGRFTPLPTLAGERR